MEPKVLATFCFFAYLSFGFIGVNTTVSRKRTKYPVCYVELPNNATKTCKAVRAAELRLARKFYKFSGPEDTLPYPHLDQPLKKTLAYFGTNPFHAEWFKLYFKNLGPSGDKATKAMIDKYGKSILSSYDSYRTVVTDFRNTVLKFLNDSTYFKYASRSYEYFTHLETGEKFLEDYYFVQERLSGSNPMAIKRVVLRGDSGTNYYELMTRLNQNFDWISSITAITEDDWIEESIEMNKVYVVEYPGLKGIVHMPDFLAKYNPGRIMRNNSAQIAIFAVDPQKRLNVVAIQNKPTKDGHVYTPDDGLQWIIAKEELQISDLFYSSVVEHLLKTHFKMEPICISMHRHLSKLHPLYQILQYHCRGLLPVNTYGTPVLLVVNQTLRSLFSDGNKGAAQLLLREYKKMVWDDVDLEVNLKARGMDDTVQMPYYPYRDDGRMANAALRRFAIRLIRKYYGRDEDVQKDYELQNMIGELSQRNGTPNADTISKVKGLPSSFQTRDMLINFVRQVLWIVVQHSVFSYSAADYGRIPSVPTKLYDRQVLRKYGDPATMLPGSITTILQENLLSGIGIYRYDVIFDYWKYLKSNTLKKLVMIAAKEMATVQRRINEKNQARHKNGQLANPYMMANWLTNSICT